MSSPTETGLLRAEVARLHGEVRAAEDRSSEVISLLKDRLAKAEAEIAELRAENADQRGRLMMYENAHMPSSSGSRTYKKLEAQKKEAAGKGDKGGGEQAALHARTQALFSRAKRRRKIGLSGPDECGAYVDEAMGIARRYAGIDPKTAVMLENAAPDMFTFMRYEGVEPTNNAAERALRKFVVRRKTMCKFNGAKGMRRMELELSCRAIWKMRGLNPADEIRRVLAA